jgi:hypothetical protein
MTDQPGRTRPFADFLAEHNQGAGHRQAGEALQRLVAAVQDTGKKGSVTIKVDVAQMKDDETLLVTTVTVTEKLPVASPKPAIFYADDEGNLTRTDPRQLSFDGLKEVPAPELKDAPAAPAVAAAGDA